MALFLLGQVSCNSYFNTDKSFWFQGAYQGPFYSARHLSLIKTFLASVQITVFHCSSGKAEPSRNASTCLILYSSCFKFKMRETWCSKTKQKHRQHVLQTHSWTFQTEQFYKNWRSRPQNSHRPSSWPQDAPQQISQKIGLPLTSCDT